METGTATAYALNMVQERGETFVSPGDEVYSGMVVGEHNRPSDLDVNPCRAKRVTNMRASGHDEAIRLTPPKRRSLEEYIIYMDDDEVLEITPLNIRLRKKILDANERARQAKRNK
jgi:GTP-binding protein